MEKTTLVNDYKDPLELRASDLDKEATPIRVEIITTFESAIKPKIVKRLENIPLGKVITPRQWIVLMDMKVPPVELLVLGNIVSLFKESHVPMSNLVKFSLAYEFLDPEVANNYIERGFGFVHRTSSKYYFQPDQRDELEEALVDHYGIASKTKKVKDIYSTMGDELDGGIAGEHHDPLKQSWGPVAPGEREEHEITPENIQAEYLKQTKDETKH